MSNPQKEMPESNPDSFKNKLKKVYVTAMLNVGKNNHNPHAWIRDNWQKLDDAVTKGPVTKEVQDAIMALPNVPDTRINKSIEDPIVKQ